MMKQRSILVVATLGLVVLPAPAGIFFNKQPKPDPKTRVPALLATLRTDQDDHKRAAAAEELRNFDPTVFPEIVPTLIDVALHDAKSNVRLDALQTLAKFRPVSQEVGMTLEQVADKDSSMRVRLQARSSLMHYHLIGYHSPKKNEAKPDGMKHDGIKTEEPPLATPAIPAPPIRVDPPISMDRPAQFRPVPATPVSRPIGAKPLPVGPPNSTPAPLPGENRPAQPKGEGPELSPPNS
jgi:hypothetical protein